MSKNSMLVLGMMSGTSADGIDTALVKISGAPPNLKIRLVGHTSQNFPPAIRREILRVAEQNPLTAGECSQLHARLGYIYAGAAIAACKKLRVSPANVDLIGNHGQTVFHQGPSVSRRSRISVGAAPFALKGAVVRWFSSTIPSTLQLGDGSVIANLTGITTVSDFRPADIALGGQGAPLVPFADYVLYRHPKFGRVSLNIGGIANLTVIPANAEPSDVFAFDTGPGNMLIDALVQHFTRGRLRFDNHSVLASRGNFVPQIIDALMQDPYLKQSPPKSTGREYFGRAYLQKLLALGRRHKAKSNDLVRATTIFSALSIADAVHRFVLPKTKIQQLIVSGGGAANPLLMAQLAALLGSSPVGTQAGPKPERRNATPGSPRANNDSRIEILPSSRLAIPTEAKEALAFAILAYETFHQRPGNLPSATGAGKPAILGKISYALLR